MMKYGIGAVALILGGLIAWYVFSNNPTTDNTENMNSTPEVKSPVTETSSPSVNQEGTEETTTSRPSITPLVEGQKNTEGTPSENLEEESDEEDYGEPVSKEDFKDFITTALDELAEDETTALAIVKEMDKISRAQPSHEEEVARFYRECAKRPKVSPKVQEACQQAMRERGL